MYIYYQNTKFYRIEILNPKLYNKYIKSEVAVFYKLPYPNSEFSGFNFTCNIISPLLHTHTYIYNKVGFFKKIF